VVLCFNYRTDRCREITEALTQRAFPKFGMEPLDLHYVTMTEYDPTFRNVQVLFRKDDLAMTLGEVVSRAGLRQIRIAETEKYPHVSFFFSGGREKPFDGESRLMVPSPKVATYDLQPEMSAQGIVDAIVPELQQGNPDLVVLNFANPDMVGHTGVFDAIVKAVETADDCARQVVDAGLASGYSFVIIADHGNADKALNPDGSPNTAHSMNPVPIIVLNGFVKGLRSGILADVAPTILDLMNVEKPAEMTGSSLLIR
jgi:2,3-bisphosphoglycerate-independent phosphoglycerate mutase